MGIGWGLEAWAAVGVGRRQGWDFGADRSFEIRGSHPTSYQPVGGSESVLSILETSSNYELCYSARFFVFP